MSGYCNECGNQHCICDEIKQKVDGHKMKYKVYITLYGRKLQFSTNAENRSQAERNILDKIRRAIQFDDIRVDDNTDIVDELMGIFGMSR